jgi:predicted aspartyl protease
MITMFALALLATPQVQEVDRDPPGPKRTILPDAPVVLEADTSSGWFAIEVMVDGRGPYEMMLDTGAMGMVLFTDLAEELELEVTGQTTGGDPSDLEANELDVVALPVLQVGDATFEGIEAVAWQPPPGLPQRVRGIVGMPVFRNCLLTLDRAGGSIRIEKGALPEPDGRRVIAYHRDEFGTVTIPLKVADQVVDAHIDSGNATTVLLPKRLEEYVSILPGTETSGRGMRASGAVDTTGGVMDGALRIGMLTLSQPKVRFDPKLDHANLGGTFLEACVLTFDQENLRLRLSREERQRHPAAPQRTVLREPVVMPIDLSSGRPVVDVMVAGRGPFPMILDTGAGRTVLYADLAAELELEVTGKSRIGDPTNPDAHEVDVVTVPFLQVGDALFERIEAVAWELPPGMSLPGTRGILGIPTFADCLISIDYAKSEVRIEEGALPAADGRSVLDMKDTLISVPLQVDGMTVDAHLDTGNGGEYVLPKAFESKLSIVAGTEFSGRGMRASGPIEFSGGVIDTSLSVGSFVVDKPRVNFDPKLQYGNLGRAFFEQCAITIDQANRRLRVRPLNVAVPAVSKKVENRGGKRRLGAGMRPLDGSLSVAFVEPGSLGERAGLRAGDLLLEVDGSAVTFADAKALTDALDADDAFTLTVERGSERVDLEVPAAES